METWVPHDRRRASKVGKNSSPASSLASTIQARTQLTWPQTGRAGRDSSLTSLRSHFQTSVWPQDPTPGGPGRRREGSGQWGRVAFLWPPCSCGLSSFFLNWPMFKVSPDAEFANTLILHFPSPRTLKNKFGVYKHLVRHSSPERLRQSLSDSVPWFVFVQNNMYTNQLTSWAMLDRTTTQQKSEEVGGVGVRAQRHDMKANPRVGQHSSPIPGALQVWFPNNLGRVKHTALPLFNQLQSQD